MNQGFPGSSAGKESACMCGRPEFNPWVGKVSWRREWLPTPIFWPGEFHGQRSLTGCCPWNHKKSNTTEWLSLLGWIIPSISWALTMCQTFVLGSISLNVYHDLLYKRGNWGSGRINNLPSNLHILVRLTSSGWDLLSPLLLLILLLTLILTLMLMDE